MFIEGHETTDFVLFIDFTLCDLISRNDQQYEPWLILFKYILIQKKIDSHNDLHFILCVICVIL